MTWVLVPMGEPVTLNACPPGPFEFNGSIGFRSEYATTLEEPRRYQVDAYCFESGEYFWGGASGTEARAQLVVQPLALSTLSADAIRQGEGASLPAGAEPLTFSSAVPKFPDDEATVPHGFEIWVHTTSPLIPTMEDAYAWAKQYIAAATPASHASDGGKAA